MQNKWYSLLAMLGGLTFSTLSAQTSVIFVSDDAGHVGRYDTTTNVGTALGSLAASGFSPGQVIGLAYNPAANQVLLFDRSVYKVYAMDAMTGVATVLFDTGSVSFQGGAVLNGLIYGIDENTQNLEAYTFSGVIQNLTGPGFSGHVHSLGVNPITGEIFYHTSGIGVRLVSTGGIEGAVLLTPTAMGGLGSEDIDYFNGNYLLADYSTQLYLINGTTGANSVFFKQCTADRHGRHQFTVGRHGANKRGSGTRHLGPAADRNDCRRVDWPETAALIGPGFPG